MIKRDKRDAAFSKLIRARAGYRCERCGARHAPNSQGLHCSHFIGRGKQATRWLPCNAFALCYGCHQYLGSRPQEHTDFAVNKLGLDLCIRLADLKHTPVKAWTVKQKAQIYEEMKVELKRLKEAEAGCGEFFSFSLPTAESVLSIDQD